MVDTGADGDDGGRTGLGAVITDPIMDRGATAHSDQGGGVMVRMGAATTAAMHRIRTEPAMGTGTRIRWRLERPFVTPIKHLAKMRWPGSVL